MRGFASTVGRYKKRCTEQFFTYYKKIIPKGKVMGKPKTIVEEAKQTVKNNKKEANAVKHTQLKETLKTILITVLVTAIFAFIGGVTYEQHNADAIHSEAKSLASSIKVEPSKQ